MGIYKVSFVLFLGLASFVQSAYCLDINQWQTKNGATILFVESHDLPIIDVRMLFKAGSSRDNGNYGVSRLTSALLVEGTGELTSEQVALSMESAGARLGHNSLKDMAWTTLRLLSNSPKKQELIDLFSRVTALPSFPIDAFKRDKNSILVGLESRKKSIGDVTSDAFFEAVYANHPYAVNSHGTTDTLKDITRQQVLDFHKKYYVAKNASIAIVGDLSNKEAHELAEKLVQHLPEGEATEALPIPQKTEGKVKFIDFPSTQTHILKGLPVMSRSDPDYFPLYVGNHILGGSGFGSRLMSVLRQEKGLTYGVYSYFSPMESKGPFQMSMQTANHQVPEARRLLSELLDEFIKNGPTDDELYKSKKNITGSFPLKLDSNKKIVEYLSLIGFYHLDLDYLDTFNEKVMKVTNDQIKQAFKRRVKQNQIIEIVVGPLKPTNNTQ